METRGGSRIPRRRGRQPCRGVPTYDFAKFSKKLHEIEKILVHRGATPPPLDPPLETLCLTIHSLNHRIDSRLFTSHGSFPESGGRIKIVYFTCIIPWSTGWNQDCLLPMVHSLIHGVESRLFTSHVSFPEARGWNQDCLLPMVHSLIHGVESRLFTSHVSFPEARDGIKIVYFPLLIPWNTKWTKTCLLLMYHSLKHGVDSRLFTSRVSFTTLRVKCIF